MDFVLEHPHHVRIERQGGPHAGIMMPPIRRVKVRALPAAQLASALTGQAQLWSLDSDLAAVSRELKIAFVPS